MGSQPGRGLTLAIGIALAIGTGPVADAQDASPAQPVDEYTQPQLATAARAMEQGIEDLRSASSLDRGLWSEWIAIVLREYLDQAIALGWTGEGPLPAGMTPMAQRAALHGAAANIPVLLARVAVGGDPVAAADELWKREGAERVLRTADALVGVAIRPAGGQWLVLVGAFPNAAKRNQPLMDALEPFVERARSDDPAVRATGLRGLGESKSTSALPPVRDAMRAADAPTRAVAAEALGNIRSRACIPLLLHLAADAEAAVRTAAFAALATLTNQTNLGEDLAAWTQWWASAQGQLVIKFEFAMPTAKEPLSVLLEQWTEAVKHRDTLKQVEILKSLRDHPEAGERDAIKLMLGALKSNDRTVLFEACRAVAWNRLKEAVAPLMNVVKGAQGKDNDTAKVGLLALAQIGDLRALPLITDSPWDSKNGEVFYVRVHVARYFRSNKTVDWLIGLITIAEPERIGPFAKPLSESLEHLTGETFGQDGRAWKDWWKKAKTRFRPEGLPDDYRVEWLFVDPGAKKQ